MIEISARKFYKVDGLDIVPAIVFPAPQHFTEGHWAELDRRFDELVTDLAKEYGDGSWREMTADERKEYLDAEDENHDGDVISTRHE